MNRSVFTITLNLIAVTILSSAAFAADPNAYIHTGSILIQNVNVIDGLGHEPYPMLDILIVDGHIHKTSVTGLIGDLPDENLTALPGLIDLHVHTGNISFNRRDGEDRQPEG